MPAGRRIRFPVAAVRLFKSRSSEGVIGMDLEAGDEVISMSVIDHVELAIEERDEYLRVSGARRRQGEDGEAEPESGELATEACPRVVTEVFRDGQVPGAVCHLHGGWFVHALEQPPGVEPQPQPTVEATAEPSNRGFRAWLRRVFRDRDSRRPPPPPP